MNMIIASLVCVALLIVALPHFVWAFGGTWPIRNKNRALLAQTVIGRAETDAMPSRWRSFGLGLLGLIAAVYSLAVADHDGGGPLLTALAFVFAALFLFRGILGYTPRWQAVHPVEPFRTNNKRVYSPLCLVIGSGFLALGLMRLI